MTKIVCETVDSSDVAKFDKSKYNSNNHWQQLPDDYFDVLCSTETKNWIDLFRSSYEIIEFDATDIAWMKRAAEIGKSTGRFSGCYEEELLDTVKKYESLSNRIFRCDKNNVPIGYFVRTDKVSLKCGQHGVGPYFGLKEIIESSCSCIHGHTPIDQTTDRLRYYVLPWIPICMDREFRVFVHNRRITCISSQGVYNINRTLSGLSVERRIATIKYWIGTLVNYINSVKDLISLNSYSIDIALIETTASEKSVTNTEDYTFDFLEVSNYEDKNSEEIDHKPLEAFLIELNCFGKEYAAGSALFHWLLDEEKLYNCQEEDTIYFRYVIE